MSTEVELSRSQPMTFVGLEMLLEEDGTLLIHQRAFIRELLQKHGNALEENEENIKELKLSVGHIESELTDLKKQHFSHAHNI